MPPTTLTSKKSAADRESIAQMRVMCQVDLYQFAKVVLYGHLGASNHLSDTLHLPLCERMLTTPYDENLYLLSRGFFKSSIITTAANIQRIIADPDTWWCKKRWRNRVCGPNTRILIASNKGENAEGMLAGIKGHLEGNDLLIGLFPEILHKDPARQASEWTQSAITVKRGRRDIRESTIQTIGVTGELTSKHYDHGTFDDPVGKENSNTKDEREKVWDFLNKSRPLFDPGATRDYVGTHWDDDDAWSRMRRQKERGEIKIGIYTRIAWEPCAPEAHESYDVPGHGWRRAVFPQRFCMVKRDEHDARMSLVDEWRRAPSDFNAQYLLDPVSADTEHFPTLDPKGQPNLLHEDAPPPLEDLWVCMTVDPAESQHAWADYSAICVAGFDHRGDCWLLELWQGRRDDEALVRKIYDLFAQFDARGGRPKSIGFEAIGFGKAYRHLFTTEGDRRGYYLPIIGLERDTKVTKQRRIGGIQGQWMAKQIHVLNTCEALAEFKEQARTFRMEKESKHDDLLDAVADTWQLRGRPHGKDAKPFLSDEVAERIVWERELASRRPDLDQMSLRMAWQHHQYTQQARDEQETRALHGDPVPALWG